MARTDDFQQLARELAIQVAGFGPLFVSREEVPADVLDEKRRAFSDEAAAEGAWPIGSATSSRAS